MALTVKEPTMKEELALFEKLLDDPYYSALKGLIETGEVKAQFAFYNIALHWGNGQVIAANMPLSIPTLQSIAKGDPKLMASRKVMRGLYKELVIELGHSSLVAMGDSEPAELVAEVPPEVKEKLVAQAKAAKAAQEDKAKFMEALKKPAVENEAAPAKPKVKSASKVPFINPSVPVPLRSAMELGQLVNGTSPGAKYYMVAGNDHLKIAIRKQPKSNMVSIRAEGTPTTTEAYALIQAGMGKTGMGASAYWSVHMKTRFENDDGMTVEVPAGRIVGAFLMGLGIKFDQAILNIEDIPEDK